MARLQGSLDGAIGHVRYTGRSFAVAPGRAVTPLFDLDGTSAVRVIAQPGGVYQFLFTEFAVYLDPATGLPLERWKNPLTGEEVEVWALRNGPINYALDPAKATFGAFNRLGGPPATGFQLPWQVYGDRAVMSLDSVSSRKNALDPAEWPRESSGPMLESSEHSTYVIALRELQSRSPWLPFVASLQSLKPWLPWMMMGQAPGRIFTKTVARRSQGIAELAPATRAYVEKHLAAWIEPPATWTGDYQTTFALYKATHTPRKDAR